MTSTRREFIKRTAFAAGSLHTAAFAAEQLPNTPAPQSDISVWFTNDRDRFSAGDTVRWQAASETPAVDSVRLVPDNKFQEILGFGGCFSDAACFQISQMEETLD